MFSRIRIVVGLAFLFALITSITAFAKGSFAFITIVGSNMKDAVRVTDSALTTDFFAFADFYRDSTMVPTDPGEGYEIARYYIDGKRESAFDQLHYYPSTGYVYYDGIVNGSSEYDGKWYKANPEIKTIFETVLTALIKPASSDSQPQPIQPVVQMQPGAPIRQAPPVTPIVVVATSLVIILVFAFWRRKPAVQ